MLADAEEELGRIDAVAGDGDHGRGMVKGSAAASQAAARAGGRRRRPGLVLTAGRARSGREAGGTSGVLWARCSARWEPGSVPPDDRLAAVAAVCETGMTH